MFFFILGLVQSLQSGWFFQSVFVFAAAQQFKLEDLPWLTLYSMSYACKWLLAPLADYCVRKGFSYAHGVAIMLWILVALWGLLIVRFHQIDLFFWVVMGVASIVCSNIDNWIDAHRITDYADEKQTELLQANVLGYRLGLGFLTGLLVYSTTWFGWRWCFIFFALLCLIAALWVSSTTKNESAVILPQMKEPISLAKVLAWRTLFGAVMIRFGDSWMQVLIVWYLMYFHAWDSVRIGLVLQMCGGVASMFGVWAASSIVKKYGFEKLLWYGVFVSMLLVVFWISSYYFHDNAVNFLVVVWCFWVGVYGFLFSRWMVENTCRLLPGTHFSILTSLARIPTALSAAIAGPIMAQGNFVIAFSMAFAGYAMGLLAQHLKASSHKK